jgi:hypothetical protein
MKQFSADTTALFTDYCYKAQMKEMGKICSVHRGDINHTENYHHYLLGKGSGEKN